MNTQKICFSKQTTFIILVFTLLLGYVLFAYRTMVNKTSTDSRASNTTKTLMKNNKIISSDCATNYCQSLTQQPVLSKLGELQFVDLETKELFSYLQTNGTYAVFYKKVGDDSSTATFLFSGNPTYIKKRLQSFFKPEKTKFDISNITSYEFYIEDITPLDKILSY